MPILQLVPVSRTGMRFLISLYGLSETGKTLSALKLAAGMQPDPGKRMLLDTEGGQRGRAYADHVPGGYIYGRLTPPFTPERYIEALNEIEAAGITVLTIDSVSHAWFAEGGILDMVESATEKNDMAKWAKPKRRLGKMTRRLLSSDMHVILCSRAKQPLVEEVGQDGRKKLVLGPVVPVQEKTLRYDMTIMAQMLGDGRFTVAAPAGKCPGALRDVFAASPVMNEETGRKLIAWLGAETAKSPQQRALEQQATEAAERGTEAMRGFWTRLAKEDRALLQPLVANYQSIAKAADAEAERIAAEETAANDAGAEAAKMADPFGAGPAQEPALTGLEQLGEPAPAEPTDADMAARDQIEKLLDGLADCRTKGEVDDYLSINASLIALLPAAHRATWDAKVEERRAVQQQAARRAAR